MDCICLPCGRVCTSQPIFHASILTGIELSSLSICGRVFYVLFLSYRDFEKLTNFVREHLCAVMLGLLHYTAHVL